jgi:hypothetical protein
MFRKTIFALTATAAIGAAALAPTTASAGGGGHHGGGFHGFHGFHGFGGFGLGLGLASAVVASSCWQYQWVETRRGLRQILVNVCAD